MDLALVTFGCNVQTDEPVRREPLVWVTSARHSTHLLDVMPLAISHAGCEWRATVLAALEKTGRKYRAAYSSPNSNAVNAAVQSGLAVGAVPEMCVRPGMRVLTEKDGFPSLGSFEIGLMRKPGRSSSAVEALARHVAASLGNLNAGMMAAE
jgi:DNA-binding transcriptional LysR family regulator